MPAAHKGTYRMPQHEDSQKHPEPVIGWVVMVFGQQFSVKASGHLFSKDIKGPGGRVVRIQLTRTKKKSRKSRKIGRLFIPATGWKENMNTSKGYFMTRILIITCFQNGKRVPAGDFYFAGHQSGAYIHNDSEYIGTFLN